MVGFQITQCACNYRQNPLGIDTPPRFSWKMQSDRPGDRQTAYRIVVWSGDSPSAKSVAWDSGRVAAPDNISLSYGGEPLAPRTRYRWQVTAWNRYGDMAQGPTAFFETGKLEEPWRARWITAPFLALDKADKGAPCFRRAFALRGPVQSARLYICGLGYFEAWLEGRRISEDLLEPDFTKYDALAYYKVYDVTQHMPAKGCAAIGILLGNGWYNCFTEDPWNTRQASWRAVPKLLCELHLAYEDGTRECICSDPGWKAAQSPIVFNGIRNGEWYDARREIPGWSESHCDETDWENAVVTRGAGSVLKAAEVQPVRVMEELAPVSSQRTPEGRWIFDLGQNFAGKVRLTAHGSAGRELVLRYAEELTGDRQRVDQSHIGSFVRSGEFQTDRYTKKSDLPEEWIPRFVYHGFRYVEVEGLPEELEGPCVTGLVMHTSFRRNGHFHCSSEPLNIIQRLCHWSSISNCVGIPTDSPHREKNAWTGDVGAMHDQLMWNYDSFLFLQKWLDDICCCQRPDGAIPCVCPSTGWGYNWGNGPDWSMVLSTLPWTLYMYTGDLSILERYYPYICRHFAFMRSMAVDNLVSYGIGDWCAPFDGPAIFANMGGFRSPVELTDTACYYRSACLLSNMSDLLGCENPYREWAEEIRVALLKKFVNTDTCAVSGDCQTSDGCVAFHHLLEPASEDVLVRRLVEKIAANGWHLDYGILGSKYVLNSLGEHGQVDVIGKILCREDYPGYLFMVSCGLTTLAECWNLGGSHNHHMFSDVSAVFYRYFAGIRMREDVPAFRSFVVAPSLAEGVDTLACSHESPHGTISIAWARKEKAVKLTVHIPFGTQAELIPPAVVRQGEARMLESGTHEIRWTLA